ALRGEVRVNFSEALYAGDHQVAPGDELLVFLESGETQIRRSLATAPAIERSFFEDTAVERLDVAAASHFDIDEIEVDQEDASVETPDPCEIREAQLRWQQSRIGRWFVVGDGLSPIRVDSQDRDALDRLMTSAMRELETRDVSAETMRDWLVQAAALRTTRFRALFDLLITGVRTDGSDSEAPSSELSDSEKRVIAASFVRDPTPDWS